MGAGQSKEEHLRETDACFYCGELFGRDEHVVYWFGSDSRIVAFHPRCGAHVGLMLICDASKLTGLVVTEKAKRPK